MERKILLEKSVEKMLEAQSESGAFVASTTFPTYNYCWFRDSAFISHALFKCGEVEASSRFHDWAVATILRNREMIEKGLRVSPKDALSKGLYLNARYNLDGSTEEIADGDAWPNFQIDGLGTWLWSFNISRSLNGPEKLKPSEYIAVELASAYLVHFWQEPCYDYWEESPDAIHSSTLVSVLAGLSAASELLNKSFQEPMSGIQEFISANLISDGKLLKSTKNRTLDASSVGAVLPFVGLGLEGFDARRHLHSVIQELSLEGGITRYLGDTYYGGGRWILLTAWCAWAAKQLGEYELGERLTEWVEGNFDESFNLPEQESSTSQDSSRVQEWINRWGESANPLTWSYAMYVLSIVGD